MVLEKVDGIKGNLYEYQKTGVEFLLESGGRALLADSPGVGKTAQALGYVTHSNHKRNLVVCPASVKFSWESEVKKWTNLKSFIVGPQTDLKDIPADANFIIVNFDILKKFFNEFMKYKFDSLIVDECIIPQTYIATQRGQKQVNELIPGDMILTYNLKKKICEYKPLLRVIEKPLAKKLVKIQNLICTEDHKIFDGKNFIEAKNVKKTFNIKFPELKLGTSKEVLAGCLMGDSSLRVNNKGKVNARLVVGNCLKNEDYIRMKCDIIDNLSQDRLKKIWNKGYKPSLYWRAVSLTHKNLTKLHKLTYQKGERVVDKNILDMMGDAGLAVWIQDDGSCNSGIIRLNTQRYKEKGNKIIAKWFREKFELHPRIGIEKKKDGRKFFYVDFSVKDSLNIYSKIRDYVVPSMRYKFVSLESRFNRIHVNTCRVCGQRMFGLHLVRQNTVGKKVICDICKEEYGRKTYTNKTFIRKKPYDCVYDLEIKDNHNYFADGILIHNCHLIKTPSAIRSKAVKGLARNIPNVILLTGTPVLSRPIEIFNTLSIIDPRVWNNYYSFAVRYCQGHQGYWGFEAKGASNLEELKERISKYFLRRTKEEVLKELPPKNRIEIPIDLPDEERKQYELVESDLVRYMKMYKKDKTDKEIAKTLRGEKLVKLNLLREINAMGKIPTVKEMIDNIIEAGEKVLVFSSFNAPLKELEDWYAEKAVLILGDTPVEDRGQAVKSFQENPDIQIFLGGTRSAGVGITLTAASNVIFLDLPWNPADLEQSENRAHRPGATYESLNIYHVISHDTIDGFMQKLIKRKQSIIDQIIAENEEETEEEMINEYIKLLELKHKTK